MDTRGESIFNAEIPGRNTAGLPHIYSESAFPADFADVCGKPAVFRPGISALKILSPRVSIAFWFPLHRDNLFRY